MNSAGSPRRQSASRRRWYDAGVPRSVHVILRALILLAPVSAAMYCIAAAGGLARINLFPVAVLLCGSALAAVVWVWERKGELRRRWRQRGQCQRCGYDLRGNVSGVCPECGAATSNA